MGEKYIPVNLDDAIQHLTKELKKELSEIRKMNEDEFLAVAHHGLGRFLRNEWTLWWHKNHTYLDSWPAEEPKIKEWFRNKGIIHADDISGIILTSFHRSLNNIDYDIENQIKKYHEHWKKHGFADGIYILENDN